MALNPKTTDYEFMGPPGAFMMLFTLPATIYGLYYACPGHGDSHCSLVNVPKLPKLEDLWSTNSFLVVLGWFFFQAALHAIIPATLAQGQKLRDGRRLTYVINAKMCFVVSMAAVIAGHVFGIIDLKYIYHNYIQLATSAMVFSFALSIYLYIRACQPGRLLALGGNSGNMVYDFFIGKELNPRIGDFDLKFFCELRPGLIGWVVINLAMAIQQYETHGLTYSMVLVNLFQAWYVFDALIAEKCILTTMDIVQDGFGLMLAFGDLAWVPFTYTVQARFLADHGKEFGSFRLAFIVAVQLAGYYIFRGANGQKDAFRTNPEDPSVQHLETLETKRGTKLLITGWWGLSRHINYFGDWLMALAWSLTTGFAHPITYFYPGYFAVLLIHRERRDDHCCKEKYGGDWDKYCEIVPSRIVPGIY